MIVWQSTSGIAEPGSHEASASLAAIVDLSLLYLTTCERIKAGVEYEQRTCVINLDIWGKTYKQRSYPYRLYDPLLLSVMPRCKGTTFGVFMPGCTA